MKIYYIGLLARDGGDSQALASAKDLSKFGYFEKKRCGGPPFTLQHLLGPRGGGHGLTSRRSDGWPTRPSPVRTHLGR